MNSSSMKMGKGTGKYIWIVVLLVAIVGGYGFYWYRHADLDALGKVVSDLPSNVSASEIVKPDYSRVPIRDSAFVVPGHYTIIEYRQKNCPGCELLDSHLTRFLMLRKDVAVRKIDLADHWSDKTAMRDFGRKIWFTPFVVIYGADGKQIKADDGGKRDAAQLLNQWLESEFAAEQKGKKISG